MCGLSFSTRLFDRRIMTVQIEYEGPGDPGYLRAVSNVERDVTCDRCCKVDLHRQLKELPPS